MIPNPNNENLLWCSWLFRKILSEIGQAPFPQSLTCPAFTCWTEYSRLKSKGSYCVDFCFLDTETTPASSSVHPESNRGLRTKTRPCRGLFHGQLRSDEAADSTISRGPCRIITPPPENMCPTCPSPPLFDRKLWEEWTRWLHRASTTRVGSLPEVIDICAHRRSVSSQLAPHGGCHSRLAGPPTVPSPRLQSGE